MQLTVIRCDRCCDEAKSDDIQGWQVFQSSFSPVTIENDEPIANVNSSQIQTMDLCPGCADAIRVAMKGDKEKVQYILSGSRAPKASLEEVEIQHIVKTLVAYNWNKSTTAAVLKIERSTLDRKLKAHNITRPGSADPKTTEGA